MVPSVHIIRQGQSLHNVDRNYPHRDPPLTTTGHALTKQIKIPVTPNLIVISPMTRTIQTAINTFPSILGSTPFQADVQIWPDLREAHDANCNKGLSRAEMKAKFPQFDFEECLEEWDHAPHTIEGATTRVEAVCWRLKELSKTYTNITLITHRGLLHSLSRVVVLMSVRHAHTGSQQRQKRRFMASVLMLIRRSYRRLVRRSSCHPAATEEAKARGPEKAREPRRTNGFITTWICQLEIVSNACRCPYTEPYG